MSKSNFDIKSLLSSASINAGNVESKAENLNIVHISVHDLVPCAVETELDEIKKELLLITTNSTARQLTDWERIYQSDKMKELLKEYKKKENLPGRIRDLVAKALDTSPSQVGRMDSISKKLSNEFKEELKEQNINISTAYEISTLSDAVQQEIKELEKSNSLTKQYKSSYFQKTEKLLYSYNSLIEAIQQKEMDIQFLEKHGMQNKSSSVVLYSSSNGMNEADKYIEVLQGYTASKERTERLVRKIENALDVIKEDSKFNIIEAKYLKKLTNEQIAEEYNFGESTIRRHKNRLINELQVILFGADALIY